MEAQVESSPSNESEPVETEELGDWAEAAEVYEESEPSETDGETQKIETKEAEPESHLEQGQGELNLDDLPIPHKYKGKVKERLDKVVSEYETKLSEVPKVKQELGQTQEAVLSLVNVLKDVAEHPEKIPEYVTQYGHLIGLDPSVVRVPQKDESKGEHTFKEMDLQSITSKYAEKMLTTEDPKEFVGLLMNQNIEIANAVQQGMMGKVGQLLQLYHEQYIKPDKMTLSEFKKNAEEQAIFAEHEAKRGSWNSALENVKTKHPDVAKYEPKIRKFLKEKKTMNAARLALNQDPNDLQGREELIEEAYHLLSREDQISNIKRQTRKSGLPPASKHINTVKQGGSDWDEIRNDPELGWS